MDRRKGADPVFAEKARYLLLAALISLLSWVVIIWAILALF